MSDLTDRLDDSSFGPFTPFVQDKGRLSSYFALLRLHYDRAERTFRLIREAAKAPDAERFTVLLLRDRDWRRSLVGAVAACYMPTPTVIEEVWQCVDAGSWVSPQLLAVLSVIDRAFADRALQRLREHESRSTGDQRYSYAKSASSIIALLLQHASDHERATYWEGNQAMRKILVDDIANGGAIATSWKTNLNDVP